MSTDQKNLLRYETFSVRIYHVPASESGFFGPSPSHTVISKGRFVFSNVIPKAILGAGIGENPTSFELENETPVDTNYSTRAKNLSFDNAIQIVSNSLNDIGYSIKSVVGSDKDGWLLIFEKATSYREEELYKLLGELNAKINATSKSYIEKAKTEINQNVLEYLKGIPDEVLAKSFKEQLLENLSLEIDDKLSKMKEEILIELKNPNP